jgi:hypothetical protein
VSAFSYAVLLERARLALADPEGEPEAIVPMTREQAYDVLIEHERRRWQAARNSRQLAQVSTFAPRGKGSGAEPFDDRDLIRALGGDPAAGKGMLLCPAHEDRHPSLSWRLTATNKVLVHCHAGCSFDEIRRAVA